MKAPKHNINMDDERAERVFKVIVWTLVICALALMAAIGMLFILTIFK